jgi:hypothetical protein
MQSSVITFVSDLRKNNVFPQIFQFSQQLTDSLCIIEMLLKVTLSTISYGLTESLLFK